MIDILLATYNGELYLREQINSIYNQTFSSWKICTRDDLSCDQTLALIMEERDRCEINKIYIIPCLSRLGAIQNFGQLLQFSNSKYIMFCDQDDVWLPEKIELTFKKMQEMESQYGIDAPILVHTDLKVVDKDLNIISNSLWKYQNLDPDTGTIISRLLVQNVITGCTMMINQPLKAMIGSIPTEAVMYDWWIALVAAVFGKIDYIASPTILYRQHSHNDTGARQWGTQYILNRAINLDRVRNYYHKTVIQSKKFLELYADKISLDKLAILQNYADMNQKSFCVKRLNLIKLGYYKIGSFRNLGLFLVV